MCGKAGYAKIIRMPSYPIVRPRYAATGDYARRPRYAATGDYARALYSNGCAVLSRQTACSPLWAAFTSRRYNTKGIEQKPLQASSVRLVGCAVRPPVSPRESRYQLADHLCGIGQKSRCRRSQAVRCDMPKMVKSDQIMKNVIPAHIGAAIFKIFAI